MFFEATLGKVHAQKRVKGKAKRWKNRAANKRVGWLQQKAKTWQPSRKRDGCKSERKRGLKKNKKGAGKVPKRSENKGERGQPTKRKVGSKILANMTVKQRQVWLQIKGERGQRRVEEKR